MYSRQIALQVEKIALQSVHFAMQTLILRPKPIKKLHPTRYGMGCSGEKWSLRCTTVLEDCTYFLGACFSL